MKLTFPIADRSIIDAGDPPLHQAAFVKLPILVPVGTEPISAIVVPLIGKPHRHPISTEAPQLFDEPVVQLAATCALEYLDSRATRDELGAIRHWLSGV
jgi:hypothetical protein